VNRSFEKLKVLVVDDNQHMRDIVGAILKSAGITTIRVAGNGAEALTILQEFAADVAFVDLQMAQMDGLEFTRQLRRSPTSLRPDLPIIMMTGHADQARVVLARDAGVNEFLVKPVTSKGVFDRLTAAVFKPRGFVRAPTYLGPDRRRVVLVDPDIPKRRAADGKAGKI
jgi:CheY-like chemotaxis protein